MDILSITETSEKEDTGFLISIGMTFTIHLLKHLKEGLQFMLTRDMTQLNDVILT